MNPRDETPNPDTPAAACISCIRCGYDLSGLAPADACPECGLAETWTASTLLFRAAGRETARSLADTIGSTRAAIFWSGVFASAGLISLLLLPFFAFGLVLCGVLARIISLAGWRKVLAPSPCFGQPWFEKPRRAAARVVVAECIAWFILGVLILGSFLTMHTDFQPLAIAIPIAALAALAALALHLVGMGVCLLAVRALAIQLQNRELARSLTRVAHCTIGITVLLALATIPALILSGVFLYVYLAAVCICVLTPSFIVSSRLSLLHRGLRAILTQPEPAQ